MRLHMSGENFKLCYGHSEGLTSICYDESGKYIISSGFDGNVRIWKGIDDDSPTQIKSGDKIYSILTQGDTIYVASDTNSVDKYEFPSGSPDGVLARFTGNATCIAASESKKMVAAGSSDFDLKVISTDSGKQTCFLGHQAPILSVAIDPMDEYLASTSCDGALKIWNLKDQACIATIRVLKPSNDIRNSESLEKICWRPATGEDIVVPTSDGVRIYSRITWQLAQSFTTTATTKTFQCASFSPCGRFIAGASVDGWIVIWDAETQECLTTKQHPLKTCITTVVWNPQENNAIAFCDSRGQVGVWNDVVSSKESTEKQKVTSDDLNALFDDDDDDNMMVDLMADVDHAADKEPDDLPDLKKRSKPNLFADSDNESVADAGTEGTQDLPPIPSTLDVFAQDNLDLDPPTIPSNSALKTVIDDDASSVATAATGAVISKFQPSSMQPAFQSSSTPIHLSHRFMVWNSIGAIRCYNDEAENAIDVEFHDAQTHHPLHLSNSDQFTMADVSSDAVVLAAESTDESPSKIKCVHFSSWDNNKEWTVDMPDGEEIQSVTIGECWIAVCTDSLQVRLFSLGGTQRQIFSIPGPVVAMSAHTDQLLIAYHVTQGFGSSQCLGFMLLEVGAGNGCKPKKVVAGQPLPISTGSTLTWLGFTAEGTPATVDSTGVIRLMNRAFCGTWTIVLQLKKITKSRYDHYWVVGLHENPQQVRCILCKGLTYPQTLPRPTVTVLQYKLPMCELKSDKGKFEEEYWRTRLFTSYSDYLTSRGYEEDAAAKQKSQLEVQHVLMRLFALCCKTDQEFQAHDVCSLMPSTASVNLAIKYASRMRKIILAQKLSEVAQEKAQDEMDALRREQKRQMVDAEIDVDDEDEEEDDFKTELQAGYSTSETEWSKGHTRAKSRRTEVARDDSDVEVISQTASTGTEPEPEAANKSKPVRSLSSQLAGTRRNPFKKSTPTTPQLSTPSHSAATSGGSVLDGIKRTTPNQTRRAAVSVGSVARGKSKGKESSKKQKKSGQSTLFSTKLVLTSTPKAKKHQQREDDEATKEVLKESQGDNSQINDKDEDNGDVQVLKENDGANKEVGQLKGVQLYIEEKLPSLQEENPDLDGIETRKLAIRSFRALSAEDREMWNERAASAPSSAPSASSGQKRKHEREEDDENSAPADQPTVEVEPDPPAKATKHESSSDGGGTRSRLAAFAFTAKE